MLITTGRVNGGRIEIDDERLPAGTTVTILAPENGEEFEATPDEEARLLAAIAEPGSGNVIEAYELLCTKVHEGKLSQESPLRSGRVACHRTLNGEIA